MLRCSWAAPFLLKLLFINRADALNRIRLSHTSVRADSSDAREPQRPSRSVFWAFLDFVIGHLDHHTRRNENTMAFSPGCERFELAGHRHDLRIRQTLEGLPHGEQLAGVRVARLRVFSKLKLWKTNISFSKSLVVGEVGGK